MKLLADAKSHFSIGESLLEAADIAEIAAARGYEAVALCDTMTISALPDFTRACEKHGIKPIIGVRLRIVPDLERVKKQPVCYPKIFILDDEGFRIVTRLLSVANDDEHFFHKPRLTWDDLFAALDDARGHVAVASGTLYSVVRERSRVEILREIGARLCASHTLIEITPSDSPLWDRQAYEGYKLSEELGLPILLGRPLLYGQDDHAQVLSLLGAIASNRKVAGIEDYRGWVKDYVPTAPRDLLIAAKDQVARIRKNIDPAAPVGRLRMALADWGDFAGSVSFHWQKMDVTLPVMASDEDAELTRLAKQGLRDRLRSTVFGHKVAPADVAPYVERLKSELEILKSMGFSGYFLLTREIVMWAKQNDILVGPGRGSVGGSLVAYVLGITDTDSIRFNLIFERFINPERLDLPDADLDFMSTRRHEVIEHIEATWGRENVAGISNYTALQSRSAIADVGRILDLPIFDRAVSKHIPEEHGTPIPLERAVQEVDTVKGFAERNPAAWRVAQLIEGRNRSLGRHAAGIVIAGEPLVNRAVVERRSGEPTVNWDKRVVEDMGLVKMDILGLSTLDLIAVALRKIETRHGRAPDLNAVPLDDPKVLAAFGKGDTVGVFQFESGGMRKLLKSLAQGGDLDFEDIAAATALYRPGPMDSGLLDDYVAIKQGYMSEHYEHSSMRAALESTYSVIVYQEQVMRISTDLCGFSMAEADHLRKAMGKKDRDKMSKLRPKFVDGAMAAGMAESSAEELWDKCEKFAGYAFNRSHAVEYSLISYQTMWLKVHHPLEFYAAALTILNDEKKQGLIVDCKRRGIDVLPPDINNSTSEFEILNDRTLVAPFNVVKQVSQRATDEIVSQREADGPFESIEDVAKRCAGRLVNSRVRGNLDKIGAFARVEPGQLPATDVRRKPDQLELCAPIMQGGVVVTRGLNRDKDTVLALRDLLIEERDGNLHVEGGVLCAPKLGKRARFMAVVDGPGWSEEQEGQFTKGKSFDYVRIALANAGLEIADGYWTGLCKVPKPKGAKLYTPDQIGAFTPLFRRELELFKPQVVVILGTNALRFFLPKLKGGIVDHAGKVLYQKEEGDDDRNLAIGITPAMIAFESNRQELLNETFEKVAEMVL